MAELFKIPLENDTSRKIIHIDMDAFYASIEEREQPDLRQKPLVIARNPSDTGGKGVVTTANYVARQYGVHSAMSAQKAAELIPNHQAVFKAPNFPLYQSVSEQIHTIFHTVTDKIEPIAFDEAYLDVTENKLGLAHTIDVVAYIQKEILKETQLVSSAGISYNKFLAKMASDYRKPAGRTLVLPEQAIAFLSRLPIEKFRGVGKKTAPRMQELGILTGADLLEQSEMMLMQNFGKLGYGLYRHVRGIDNRPVAYQRERKSIGNENTYGQPLISEEQVQVELKKLAIELERRLRKNQKHGLTVVLKVRNRQFETITKRKTFNEYVGKAAELEAIAWKIWQTIGHAEDGVRLLGITVTNLAPQTFENITLPLYDWERE
ncbi:impB mucB samB family protein [Latilactobacillus curvatus]|uniref:DNA polymerase IV n=1 Tax=Latilactobacillus curvatus TaxID=28038 RepID=A0ABN6GJD8_LATCU|nr:DNA polymerase IV [Latilactobacillus curvatus]ANJ68842.1 DNA polymerase IV [Latilactobacillus curvatus]KHO12352.1 impB mucB samB family protein [Latilactobacillus curvatus]BBE26818.1 DNA polymerase IV [Latilactobacillus curvatus]BCX30317.1 DNA polymerase IV [Latilactobacillus curvatus]